MKLLSLLLLLFVPLAFAEPSGGSAPYQYFSSHGTRIAYREFGQGPYLIVLNGGPGRSSETFSELAVKLSQVAHRKVVLFDQRGTGRSKIAAPNEETVSLSLMVEDLEGLRLHLGLERMAILGHSFGGMYAMAYASLHPDRVSALVLSASGGPDLSWREYAQHNMLSRLTEAERRRYEFWTSPEQERKDPVGSSLEALRVLLPAYVYHREFVPRLEHDLVNLRFYNPAINGLVWASMKNYDVKESLRSFSGPALVLAGRQDVLGEMVPYTIHQLIPGSRLEFLDECSHYPWLDAPEKYFSLIAGFLADIHLAWTR